MPNILEKFRRYMKRARMTGTITTSDEYRRGYLEGLRRHYDAGQFDAKDEHAQWLGFADTPEYVEVGRGYRDGLAGVEPRP